MKKIVLVFLIMLVGCNNNIEKDWTESDFSNDVIDGIEMESEFTTYIEGANEIQLKVSNTLNDKFIYGEYFEFEKKIDNTWRKVTRGENHVIEVIDIGYDLSQGEHWRTYSLERFTSFLDSGEYRLVIEYHRLTNDGVDYSRGNYPKYHAVTYFNVSDEKVKRNF